MFKKTTVVNQQKLRNDLVKRLKRDLQLALPSLVRGSASSPTRAL
jgi:hypothetical protein